MLRRTGICTVALLAFASFQANATAVHVTVTGEVEFNQISIGPLADAVTGDAASMTFRVDSDVFTDSGSFPTRGYHIDQSSFVFTAGPGSVGLADPFPGTPYFVLRDNDPMVDGFFVASSVDFPIGVPSDSEGGFGPFTPNFSVGYTEDTLGSLDILAAVGTYDFTGLTNFNLTVDDGPFNAMGLIFEQMTITAVPVPAAVWLFGSGLIGLLGLRRKR